MKKLIVLLVLTFAVAGSAYAQRKARGNGNVIDRERRIPEFDKVKIDGDFEVVFLNNEFDKKIVMHGDANLQGLILAKVEDGVLSIGYKGEVEILEQTVPLKVTIPTRSVVEITNSGSGVVRNMGIIEAENLVLNNTGEGSLELNIKTQNSAINLAGSGKIVLSGRSNTATFKNNGSGVIDGKEMSVFFSEITVGGSGNVYTNTLNGIDGNINGSGNIYYKVTKTVSVEENGTGKALRFF